MSNSKALKSISEYYNNLVEKYGHDPRSCDYGHANSQKIKFSVLSEATGYDNKSVLDIGCGFADYCSFLTAGFENVNYTGVDISEGMIKQAKAQHPDIQIELKNVFEDPFDKKFDVVTSNGIFYLLGANAQQLMFTFITKMFAMAEEVVAFNSLSTWANDQVASEFYADPSETMEFCRQLTPWVTLRHDYHPRDFTIYMYKNRNI